MYIDEILFFFRGRHSDFLVRFSYRPSQAVALWTLWDVERFDMSLELTIANLAQSCPDALHATGRSVRWGR